MIEHSAGAGTPPLPRPSSTQTSPQAARSLRRAASSATTGVTSADKSPIRTASPGLGHITDRDTYWTVTQDTGCVPALHFALTSNGQWWGGRFGGPLAGVEDLVAALPEVIRNKILDERIQALEEIDLYASTNQRTLLEGNEVVSTGPGHLDSCYSKLKKRSLVILNTDVERERCFALYAFLANAYVFSRERGSSSAAIVLPAVISVPLCRLATQLGRRPITDYASSVLNNWELADVDQGFSMENLICPRTFTGLESEKWFYNIHALIEKHGGEALIAMLMAREEISQFMHARKLLGTEVTNKRAVALQRLLGHSKQFSVNPQAPFGAPSPTSAEHNSSFDETALSKARNVERHMEHLLDSLNLMNETLKRLPERCPPDEFFDKIRPWVSSWPDPGVVYMTYCDCGVDESRRLLEPKKYSGASGAQSSLLPSIDGFLGIAYGHKQNMEATPDHARTDLGAFIRQLKSFRLSMPLQHRDLVSRFESQGNIREFIDGLEEYLLLKRQSTAPSSVVLQLDDELSQVKMRYNACIETLTLFRKTHMDFAVTYIRQMAVKKGDGGGLAGVKGTGGSDYAKHLGQHIVDTKKSLYDIKELFSRDG